MLYLEERFGNGGRVLRLRPPPTEAKHHHDHHHHHDFSPATVSTRSIYLHRPPPHTPSLLELFHQATAQVNADRDAMRRHLAETSTTTTTTTIATATTVTSPSDSSDPGGTLAGRASAPVCTSSPASMLVARFADTFVASVSHGGEPRSSSPSWAATFLDAECTMKTSDGKNWHGAKAVAARLASASRQIVRLAGERR